MADFGFQGFPARPEGVDRMSHYRTVLEMAPPAFSTVWISDHLQFGHDPVIEGWTLLTYLAASFPRFHYGHLVLDVGVGHFQVSFDDMTTYRRFIAEVVPVVRLERRQERP